MLEHNRRGPKDKFSCVLIATVRSVGLAVLGKRAR